MYLLELLRRKLSFPSDTGRNTYSVSDQFSKVWWYLSPLKRAMSTHNQETT
jgi:hypothetical protein